MFFTDNYSRYNGCSQQSSDPLALLLLGDGDGFSVGLVASGALLFKCIYVDRGRWREIKMTSRIYSHLQ
jgi:hypothetical protein